MVDREQSSSNTDGSANEPSPGDEFDAAVAEASAGLGTPPTEDVGAVGENEQDDQDGADETSAPADPAPADDGPGDDQAAAPGEASEAKSSQADQPTDDIWAKAPPELRKAFEDFKRDSEYRYNSVKGRVSALDRELERFRNQSGRKQDGRDTQDAKGNEAAADTGLSEEATKQLREDYPELAGPILDRLKAQEERIAELSKGQGEVAQERQQAKLKQEEGYLTEQHPDWLQAAADERFLGWLGEQPRALQEAFERNHSAIVDGKDAAFVIGKFKADTGFGKTAPPAQQDDPQQGDDQNDEPEPKANDKRRKQLESGRDAGRGGSPVTSGIPDDLDAAIEHFASRT